MRRLAVICCLGACAEPPAEGEQPLFIEVVTGDTPRADGVGQAEIRVRWDEATEAFGRAVVVMVSDGILGTGAQDDPRQVSGKATIAGEMVVPLTYGRTPGVVRVSAQAGEFAPVFAELEVAPRAPDAVVLRAESARLSGGEQVTIAIDLIVDELIARPSVGSRVWLRGCCAQMGVPVTCAGEPPLRVPAQLTLGAEDTTLEASVTANTVDEPTDAFLIASLTAEPRCSEDADAVFGFRID